ncbi:MAG: dihydroorotase [Acidimicrobiales bacterium]
MAEPSRRRGAPVLLKGGTVLDEHGERDADVLVSGTEIVAVEPGIEAPSRCQVIDAAGCVVAPGLVDLHTHLREPGNEVAETVESGSRAASRGGYTAVVAMPNTSPAIDHPTVVRDVLQLGRRAGMCEVTVAGAITIGREGERLAPLFDMAELGVRIFTDDGSGVQDAGVMRRALEYAGELGAVLAEHCEEEALAAGGHMHEGPWSSRLGIPGQPSLAEEAMVARDIELVRLTGSPMHFMHLSTAGSAELVRRAKAARLPITAEAAPHHLCLTDAEVASYDPVFKVNPPLRSAADVEALTAAVGTGVIDAVATDHAPHPADQKERPFDDAPPGMIGLETALSVVNTYLGRLLSLLELFSLFSWRPARIARLDGHSGGRQGGPLEKGRPANIVVFDAGAPYVVEVSAMASKSANSPFAGQKLRGTVRHTIYEGEPVVLDTVAQR